MSKHRVMVKKLYCLISAVVILTCSISVFAMVPLDAEVTVDNIMEYANEYDPDGAFILQKAIDSRDKILRWYSEDQSILEGYDTARWILLDFIDVVVHLFLEEERQFYNIERLWR